MELSLRTVRTFNRLLRKPLGILAHRSVTGTAVKEEINTELLNVFNRDIKNGGVVPVFRRALLFPTRVALQDDLGIYTYAGLYQAASVLSQEIAAQLVGESERTIAYMCNNDASHIIAQWAIWMTGNIAVPLTPLHPPEMLKYYLNDSFSSLVLCTQEFEKVLRPITLEMNKPLLVTGRDNVLTAQLYQPNTSFLKPKAESNLADVGRSNEWYGRNEALIIYTSGTTSKPKGVVWTHNMLQTQISALHSAWQYSANDVVLHTLPLHHIHGQLNSMLASLAAGARLRMLPSFVSHNVWSRLLGMGERDETKVTVFHGVPAMYARLVADYDRMFSDPKTAEYISGMRLLERFGMSEVGMALSNPYRPVEARSVGCVGLPLPGVSARIVSQREDTGELEPLVTVETPVPETQICLERLGLSSKDLFVDSDRYEWKAPTITKHKEHSDDVYHGELLIKGPAVFSRYWNRAPTLNSSDFTEDGWFRTGDTASFEDGKFRILGRTSVDIIKTGGYKVSALQVESAILDHPSIADAAVLGIEDDNYGEIVSAVVVLKENAKLTLQELKEAAGKKLAPYQLPKTLLITEEMPRNAMGKLDKKVIRKTFGKQLVLPKK
ncbi:hypothetical protein HW555_006489 [Spodoptera exigua]|uniref:Acyl-CoA synthetase family member 3, mitochondrial n=1 Tax=Spodoptera exigua TaxID=7107 RepID=A0A835L3I7_SPOEX|nr:hypothetical protein HW555_006489 [Spodoptera exigua]